MTSILVPISEEKLEELKRRATEYNIAPERLAQVTIEEMLIHKDEKFNRALDYVLAKNEELYQRLA